MPSIMLLRRLPILVARPRGVRTFSSPAALQDKIAFVGLGQMGYPMARNLRRKLTAGDELVVYDVRKEAVEQFLKEENGHPQGGAGVSGAGKLEEVVDKADTIITMLPEPQHVRGVYTSFIDHLSSSSNHKNQKLFIDSSTIDVATSLSLSSQIAKANLGMFIDAPVSGGVAGASAGTLTFMVGCPSDANTPPPSPTSVAPSGGAKPTLPPHITALLSHMGARILPCGPAGAGLAAKLANNYLLAISNIAVAEAMNLGTRLGLDPEVLTQVINTSSGRCWASEINNPVARAKTGFEGGFGTRLMAKDLRLAVEAAGDVDARLELGDKASEVYRKTEETGECKGRDFSVVYRWLGGKE